MRYGETWPLILVDKALNHDVVHCSLIYQTDEDYWKDD